MSDRPGWTCPGLDRLSLLAGCLDEPARTRALLLIEEQRVANVQLRALAAARPANAAEVERIERRIAELVARLESP